MGNYKAFYNHRRYVRGEGNSVIQHLKEKIETKKWNATLCAVDGNTVEHIPQQLKTVPADATHLFISIGGNNGLQLLSRVVHLRNPFKILYSLWFYFWLFHNAYDQMLEEVLKKNLPVIVCTIYKPKYSGFQMFLSFFGLFFFNNIVIKRKAKKYGVRVIDLYSLITDPNDYANPIEPGVQGGMKITTEIMRIMEECE